MEWIACPLQHTTIRWDQVKRRCAEFTQYEFIHLIKSLRINFRWLLSNSEVKDSSKGFPPCSRGNNVLQPFFFLHTILNCFWSLGTPTQPKINLCVWDVENISLGRCVGVGVENKCIGVMSCYKMLHLHLFIKMVLHKCRNKCLCWSKPWGQLLLGFHREFWSWCIWSPADHCKVSLFGPRCYFDPVLGVCVEGGNTETIACHWASSPPKKDSS